MSSLQRTGYESARPTHVCAATGRSLEPGERYVAALTDGEDREDLARFDYAVDAWESGARPERPLIAVWWATEADREGGGPTKLDLDELLALFEGMEPVDEGRGAVFRYLLALMLLRKRLFRVVDQQVGDNGRPVLQMVRRGGAKGVEPEIVEVVDPGMDESAIAAGIEELGALLGGAEEGAS